ncbi:MAG: diaminopropionate ammonia-lyase [Alphaproteobacteria bacterium]|nr:diaminopropionate ammonia-lyase [Alphaproteobacteria bacterium]
MDLSGFAGTLLLNPRHAPERLAIDRDAGARARATIASWPGYTPTPVTDLTRLAQTLGVGRLAYKDEGGRFGLGSFKALGGAYGVFRVVARRVATETGQEPTVAALLDGRHRERVAALTVSTATDGNHGRSVAWGASLFGCRAVIYIPHDCSPGRAAAIAHYGAAVVRTDGGYDATVRRCAADASREGRILVADTAWPGYTEIPGWVTDGYTLMVAEALAAIGGPPSHVFVQGGVGALAAALAGHLIECAGPGAVRVVVVEPDGAACLHASAAAGRPTAARAPVHSVMAGLNCGEVSTLAWDVLDRAAFAFMTVPDDVTAPTMRLLADHRPPIVAGESAIAGLAGAIVAARDPAMRAALQLSERSAILLFGTERDTDPAIYTEMVGRSAPEVLEGSGRGHG